MTARARLEVALLEVHRRFPVPEVCCIPWLHLKHPAHPVQEKLLRDDSGIMPLGAGAASSPELPAKAAARIARLVARSRSRALRMSFCFANAVRLACKLWILRKRTRSVLASVEARSFRMVAKTWCFGPPSPEEQRDFYFGDLQQQLAARGIPLLLLCGDATNFDWNVFADKVASVEGGGRLPELALCPPLEPLRVARRQLSFSRQLSQEVRRADASLKREVLKQASLDCLDPAVTQDCLYFRIAQVAAATWKPAAFLTLYEGHGWERVVWAGAQAECPDVRTMGYQHAVLFPDAAALLRPQRDGFGPVAPEVLLALGEPAAAMLRDGHSRLGTQLVPFGTFREVTRGAGPAEWGLQTVLVLPEGIAREADILFRFALAAARELPSFRFILRGHPQWPAARALEAIGSLMVLPPNVEVSSNGDIHRDFERSSVLLYRASSAAFYGVLAGLLAVFVHSGDSVGVDPLAGLGAEHASCGSAEDLKSLFTQMAAASPAARREKWMPSADYAQRYLKVVDEVSVGNFLQAAGLSDEVGAFTGDAGTM